MPFEIVRSDITTMRADAIVNTANPEPIVGAGVDSGINKKAGAQLIEARRRIGHIPVGDAAVTPAFGLDAKYVIHAAGPVWEGGKSGEIELLASCYRRALELAAEKGCESVAFPLISAGNYGFPRDIAIQTAVREFSRFLMQHEMRITLVVFEAQAFRLSEKLFTSVKSYIDENYVREKLRDESEPGGLLRSMPWRTFAAKRPMPSLFSPRESVTESVECAVSAGPEDWSAILSDLDAGFSETLLQLIDRSGKTDPEVYKRANVDRKLFSKIRNNADYKPSKPTAVAFAFALELDLEETRDLIGRAGHALSHSSKFDVIVEYFIIHKNYDIFELNEVLFAFDQPLVGA